MASANSIDKKKLTNILNYLHFNQDHLYILLKHPRYEEGILVKAHPEPCLGEELHCRWNQAYSAYRLEHYLFQYLVLAHEQSIILVPARMVATDGDGLTVQLPEQSFVSSQRQTPRFPCQDVKADLWQNGFEAQGTLIDFGPNAFRIRVECDSPSCFQWFNVDAPAILRLSGNNDVFYSGICSCMYQKEEGRNREIILTHSESQIQRFKAKVLRNPRKQSSPPLHTIFVHPFIKKQMQREVFDISTSGFSISGKPDEVVLIPGMIIPDVTITYAGILKIRCKAQVIHRKEEGGQVRFGLVILDMDLINYNHLTQVLNNMHGADTGMLNDVNLDALWEFFFDTDFIYPKKYKIIQSFKNDFRDIYQRLYEEAPGIAKHFTYQLNGRIYGHISMLRAYERTWMVHHHAARPLGGRPIGLVVLKQLMYYLCDFNRFPSSNLDYIITYFRPENKFPARVFGGFAKDHGNQHHCSLDLFTYLTFPTGKIAKNLSPGWEVRECTRSDLFQFEQFYRNHSSGLFWSMIQREERRTKPAVEEVFAAKGFKRRWQTFALAYLDHPKAFILADESDAGLNLSNLLNGFKVFVMDPDIHPDILLGAIANLVGDRSAESFSLLIYPDEYAERAGIRYDRKQYFLWIMDMQYGNEYQEFLGRKFRIRLD
ncbi:MAG: PilZ domain-containing protein [Deltaproteobacteria bacterium]|nr:PilZ domain-containing protein [Deltaproteobacteria bacterium]